MLPYVGQRVSYQGERSTVRYVGELEGRQGQWLGVEWDHDSKGKNNGSDGGRRYFSCKDE